MDVNDVFDFMEETSTPAEPSSKKEKEEESDLLQFVGKYCLCVNKDNTYLYKQSKKMKKL